MKKSEFIQKWQQYCNDYNINITVDQLFQLLEIAEVNDMVAPARLLPIKGAPLVEGQTHFVDRSWDNE